MTTYSVSEKPQQRLRFAIYARYSSDMQNELSLEDQEKCCRKAIAERGGSVVACTPMRPSPVGALTAKDLTNCESMQSEAGLTR